MAFGKTVTFWKEVDMAFGKREAWMPPAPAANPITPVALDVICFGCHAKERLEETADPAMDDGERWDIIQANPPKGWLVTKAKIGPDSKETKRVAYCPKCAALWVSGGTGMRAQFQTYVPGMKCPKCAGEVKPRYCPNTCAEAPTASAEHLHVACQQCGYKAVMLCCDSAALLSPRKKKAKP